MDKVVDALFDQYGDRWGLFSLNWLLTAFQSERKTAIKVGCCIQSSVPCSVLASMFDLYLDTELVPVFIVLIRLIQHQLVLNSKIVWYVNNKQQLYISLLDSEQHLCESK